MAPLQFAQHSGPVDAKQDEDDRRMMSICSGDHAHAATGSGGASNLPGLEVFCGIRDSPAEALGASSQCGIDAESRGNGTEGKEKNSTQIRNSLT